jgi:hypothetical protein
VQLKSSHISHRTHAAVFPAHQEDPIPSVRGADISSGDSCPINAVPCRPNGGNNSGERAASIIAENTAGIFRHNDPWAESRNNSQKLSPHPSVIGFAFFLAG